MADTRPDDAPDRFRSPPGWDRVGDWLRDVRESRGWTLDQVGSRATGRSVASRLRQVEKDYHPYGLPQTGTLRRIELAMWLAPGRLDQLIELATRGSALPNPYAEPIVQPATAPEPAPAPRRRRRSAAAVAGHHKTTSATDRPAVHPVHAR